MLVYKVAIAFIAIQFTVALSDPCASLECPKPEISCLKLISGEKHATFKCECSVRCDNVNIINVPIVQRIRPNTISKKLALEMRKPTLKQGGAACYPQPNYCMNGGTCYTQYTQTTMTAPPTQPTAYPTQSTTTLTTSSTSTTTTTTTLGTTTRYTYVTQPVCGCQPQYTGDRCEIATATTSQSTPTTVSWNNLCKIYADRNMNICQNGGQCVFISDGKVACVCPSMYVGQYCETPVYTRCMGGLNSQCHRDYGTCQPDGSCLCRSGYCGLSCDQEIQQTTAASTACLSHFCQNGGTCQQVNADPYVVCVCPNNFTGSRCETLIDLSSTTSPGAYGLAQSTKKQAKSTMQPRCNFTIGVQNDGLYSARFRVHYTVDGVQQPAYQSPAMRVIYSKEFFTIPYYSTDISVELQVLGFSWFTIHEDFGIGTDSYCTKCYKTWGAVTNAKWDYMEC